jgi:hypothetical protein
MMKLSYSHKSGHGPKPNNAPIATQFGLLPFVMREAQASPAATACDLVVAQQLFNGPQPGFRPGIRHPTRLG